jgi:exodeoxyribonuclease-3
MKIVSWNVNGIRALANKEMFFDYLHRHEPDLLFLQETKAWPCQLPEEILQPGMYSAEWVSAEKKGYSGVAMLTTTKPLDVITSLGYEEFDLEGRVVGAVFSDKVIFGVYFPNSQRPGRLEYKLRFCDVFFDLCDSFRSEGKHVIISGDFNTAHTEIDLARPNENKNSAGFLPEERTYFDAILNQRGYVDVFREQHQGESGHYSWWTYRAGARKRNIGWRIDYVLVSKDVEKKVKNVFIQSDVMGSDHCPVGIELAL